MRVHYSSCSYLCAAGVRPRPYAPSGKVTARNADSRRRRATRHIALSETTGLDTCRKGSPFIARIIFCMTNSKGKIIIRPGISIWPHELRTAEALATAGYTVEFVRKSENDYEKTPDVLINGTLWEMKAPKSSKLHMVEQNLRRALRQSSNVVFDSRRMKGLPDAAIERELRKWSGQLSSLQHLLFVSRHADVIDII